MTQYIIMIEDDQGVVRAWAVALFLSVAIVEAEHKWTALAKAGVLRGKTTLMRTTIERLAKELLDAMEALDEVRDKCRDCDVVSYCKWHSDDIWDMEENVRRSKAALNAAIKAQPTHDS